MFLSSQTPNLDTVSTTCGSGWVRRRHVPIHKAAHPPATAGGTDPVQAEFVCNIPHMKLFTIIVITVIYSLTASAQVGIVDRPQRSRVLNTKGLETAPSQLLWKSEKLFTYRATEWVDAQIGTSNPLSTVSIQLPTNQEYTGPIIAGNMLYVRCQDKKMYALSTATLTEVWSIQNGKTVPPPVIFAEDVMYSLGSDVYIHIFK